MQSIKKNLLYQISYEILVLIIPLILSPYVTRVLGSDRVGIYSFTFTTASYFVLFANLGIKNYANREIARIREDEEKLNRTFSGIMILHLLLSVLVGIVYAFYYFFFVGTENRSFVAISGLYIVGAMFDISWLFFGLEQFKITVFRNGIIRILTAVCVFIFVRDENDLGIYILIMAISNLISQLYLWRFIRRFVKLKRVSFYEVVRHFPGMAVLFVPTIAISLYNYMDKIMVGSISGNSQLGFYDTSEKIPAIAIAVIGSVGTVMMPRMSNLVAKGDIKLRSKYIDLSMNCVMCMAMAMAFGIAGVSKVFAPTYWGKDFAPCSNILMLLAIILPIKGYANVLRTQYLIPEKKDKYYIISVCGGAIVNLVVNLLLIRKLQSVGAALGTIAAEFTVCLIQAIACRKDLPIKKYLISSIPYTFIGAIMFVVVWFVGKILKPGIFTLILQIAVGMVIYSILTFLWLYFFNRQLLAEVFSKFNNRIKKTDNN